MKEEEKKGKHILLVSKAIEEINQRERSNSPLSKSPEDT